MRHNSRGLVAALALYWLGGLAMPAAAAAAAQGGDEPAPVAVEVAPVDVLGNIRRQLELAPHFPGEGPPAAGTVPPEHDRAKGALPTTSTPVPRAAAAPVASAAAPPSGDDGHVPVPNKEITIRSNEDIRALIRELDEAKRKRAGQGR